ncbi:MAG: glycosyltransferase [Paludibacteraceae bacterium]|nr:glycosyltransferase [Paludibacteraceae bacterium]
MVGLFNDSFPPIMDGVAITVKSYAEQLYKQQIPVSVITPKAPDYIAAEPYPVFRYSSLPLINRKPYRIGLPDIDLAFQDVIDHVPFSLVHAHCPFSSGHLALRIARERKIPLVATFHSKYRDDFEQTVGSRKIADLMIKEIIHFYEKADEVWIPQASVEDTIREYGYKGKLIVMENGSDLHTDAADFNFKENARKKLNIKTDENVLFFVCQHIREKNPFLILEALKLIKHKLSFKMFFIGTGYAADELKIYADTLGLSDKVRFEGVIYDRKLLQQYYAAAHLFVFPSVYDNAPLVVREAAAMQTAPLLIKGATAAEQIIDGENGFLSEHNAQSLADTILNALNNKIKLQNVGKKAAGTISPQWQTIISKVHKRYSYLIASKTP